jgi:hypothetical protein
MNPTRISRVRFLALVVARAGYANRSLSAARFGNDPAELERIKNVPSRADSRSGTIRSSRWTFGPQLSGVVRHGLTETLESVGSGVRKYLPEMKATITTGSGKQPSLLTVDLFMDYI